MFMSNEILVFNIAIIAWLKANSKMVTTPMKNSTLVGSLVKAVEAKRFWEKSKPHEQPKHFVDTHWTTQQGLMSLLGLERKLDAIEFCKVRGP